MVAAPARPSPIAAPIAPPARARPPPMNAPANFSSPAAEPWASSWLVRLMTLLVFYVTSVWLWGAQRTARGLVRGRFILFADCFTEVDDREQAEDQCLQRADEHVEQLPGRVRQPDHVRRHLADHHDHQATGEDVAPEPQRQRDRTPEELGHDLDRREECVRLGEVAEVVLGALAPEA